MMDFFLSSILLFTSLRFIGFFSFVHPIIHFGTRGFFLYLPLYSSLRLFFIFPYWISFFRPSYYSLHFIGFFFRPSYYSLRYQGIFFCICHSNLHFVILLGHKSILLGHKSILLGHKSIFLRS